ncbi:MAG TPA: GNAT family N-acetyltransferase [Pyrinomonadaceae bacterium]|nr:GNAT family N-acetyltransferase [Pyrinomonadaceae bacterium]
MPDLLVNLLNLPPVESALKELEGRGVLIRRAQPFELTVVRNFIGQHFSVDWADEVSVGFANKPVSVLIATQNRKVIGFAAHECTRKNFFGPAGVAPEMQGRGIGTALLLASLLALRDSGYVYGIIGGAGPVEFYAKTVGATVIADSEPGIYTDLLK